jgi:endo-1,4-beta-mannosidase
MLGLWVQHERHGFDYNNPKLVKAQLENFKQEVQKYKNHPALLMWGIGNEYELNYSNTRVWSAVNDIAKMIHKEDPNHPTSTVTAGTNLEKLGYVMKELKDIDIYGINTYGDIGNVKKVLAEGNFQGPYMITEWGPTGHWEIQKTMWGSSIEQTSTEKAQSYLDRYTDYIASQYK